MRSPKAEVADYVAAALAGACRRRSVRAHVARAHRRGAAVRRLLDERRVMRRAPRRPTAIAQSAARESGGSGEPGGDHRALHRQAGDEQRALLSAAAVCGVQFRVSTIADALERDAAWVAEICDQTRSRAVVARRARVPGTTAVRPSCRIRSGTRFFARCCTSAHRPSVARAAPSQGRRCARKGARARVARSRDRACAALRARPRPGDGFALLRRSRGIGAAAV